MAQEFRQLGDIRRDPARYAVIAGRHGMVQVGTKGGGIMRNIVLATIITASVVAGLAMPALADDVAQCKQLGYKPGTALFLQCLTLYQQQRAQAPAAGEARRAVNAGPHERPTTASLPAAAQRTSAPRAAVPITTALSSRVCPSRHLSDRQGSARPAVLGPVPMWKDPIAGVSRSTLNAR